LATLGLVRLFGIACLPISNLSYIGEIVRNCRLPDGYCCWWWCSLQDHLSYFRFVGRIVGLAVMHGLHISGGFTLPLRRLLLGKKITLSDIETVDPELHRSFVWILYV